MKEILFGNIFKVLTFISFIGLVSCSQRQNTQSADAYSGSESCIQCHENFYKLWSPSHHGKAMQPVNPGFIAEYQLPPSSAIELEGKIYSVAYKDSSMILVEKEGGQLLNTYQVSWSLGGRNVFCFLVPMDKGKLQTIPLAYDVNRKEWFNYPESAVRNFVEGEEEDEALPWKDRMYTFNTGCYNCHVSQLTSNYDLTTDSYKTTWKEPGINCETCHGPSAEHVRVCKEAGEGNVPEDLKIVITSTFTPEQHNASCATCHAKSNPLTHSYHPGDRFFDNFDLATLEDRDFYPDGRDLGENYTLTGWMMNECQASGDLNCVSCHTSSGRNRFKDSPNDACISCHHDKGENLEAHTMHKAGSSGSLCVSCHMPTREFVGHFLRSDHSFRPPMPEATITFGSPNACNLCHTDKSPEWANKIVKARPNGNYQEETLKWAQLIKEARENNWAHLDKILTVIEENKLNETVVTSFIRLLEQCPEQSKWPSIIGALKYGSPLIRAAAAASLAGNYSEQAKNALVEVCDDSYRLVRISAAASLAGFPKEQFSATDARLVAKATEEYKESVVTRPDDWSSHYNLGIFYQNRGDAPKALEAYETAARLYPEALMPLINSSVLYSYIGNQANAEENLKKAIEVDPDNEAANLNLGLLLAEQGKTEEAEKALKTALQANPEQAVAAYNLSVITASRDIQSAVKYAEIAAKARPDEPKYAYTLAYYQMENNHPSQAIATLKTLLAKNPLYFTAVSFLAEIYLRDGKKQEAIKLYEKTLKTDGIAEQDKAGIRQAITSIQQNM
jgi:tetratricopeptide (TPR) repeat protein